MASLWIEESEICTYETQQRTWYMFSRLKNSVAWVRERIIPIERPPFVGEVSVNFLDTGCYVVSVMDSYCPILGFLDRNRYFSFQVAPQLYSRSWVGPVPDPLLLRKSGSAGNWTRASGSVTRNSDHFTTEAVIWSSDTNTNVVRNWDSPEH
jgi:hypothetical protein